MMGITVSDCGKNVARSIGPELQSAILDTEDCDQGNSVSRLLYDYEAVQLEQASFLNKVRFTASPSGIVYRERYEAPVYHLGTLRGDFIAFALPICIEGSRWWGDLQVANDVVCASSGQEIQNYLEPGCEQIVLVADREPVRQAGFRHGVELDMFNRRQHRLRCEPALIQGIARRLSALLPADGKETLPINSRKFNSLVLAEVLLLLENATCRRDI